MAEDVIIPVLTRDAIKAKQDAVVERVSIPEWDGDVFVRVMSAGARDRIERLIVAAGTDGGEDEDLPNDIRAHITVNTVCDAVGRLIFSPADVDWLSQKSADAVDRIFKVALRLNKMRKQDLEDAKGN